jgi:transcriptional regulator with XRE-family HTH domain
LRQRNGLTLADLAVQSGLSIGLLSRLENGMGNPSLLTLSKLASTFDVPVISMYEQRSLAAAVRVRSGERIEVSVPAAGVRHQLLVPALSPRLIVSLLELSNDAKSAYAAHQHDQQGGVEVLSVLRGRVELRVDQEIHELQVGDSATYDASRMHEIRRTGRGTAELLYVTSPGRVP